MMILTPKELSLQLPELMHKYPDLTIVESNDSIIRLRGKIEVFRTACDFTIDKWYTVEITIPINSTCLPTVKELDNAISDSYPHRYKNGELCLETDTKIKWHFIDGFNLLDWAENYVEPYFFSYEYYHHYGSFPFGERPHGIIGIIDTYGEILNESDLSKIISLMNYCVEGTYRGHIKCPCGSGKKLRNCHGNILFPIMNDSRKLDIISPDIKYIREVFAKYASTGTN